MWLNQSGNTLLTVECYLGYIPTMTLKSKPQKLIVMLPPELSDRLRAEVERRSTIARRATLTSVIRELIAEHCEVSEITG